MRALHVAAGNLYGGVERMLVEIARAPGAWQHDIALAFDGPVTNRLAAAGVVAHALGPVRFSRPLSVWRARRALKRVWTGGRYDALVAHAPWACALAAPAVRTAPRVLWAHDASLGTHWTERRAAAARPDLVIANSNFTAAAVRRWLPATRVEVIYAPLAAPAADPAARAEVRRELGAGDEVFVVLMASRFERWKGHHVLLDAVARLRGPWNLWIAGAPQRPHEAAYRRELHAAAAARGIAERVRWLGARSDLDRVLRAADALCQPNTAPEPFGMIFVEALHAGVPVVASDAGGAREIVTESCGVLTPEGDAGAVAVALQRLMASPQRRAELAAGGPGRARELCDPAAQAARIGAVLASCARERVA